MSTMMMRVIVLLLFAALAAGEQLVPPANPYPLGDVRNCPVKDDNQNLYRMEVLPGVGFDNLRNLDMGQVHAYNYSTCQMSNDGKFLLPDNTFLVPVQESKLEVFSEYLDHWDNYTSMTSSSINVDASYYSLVSGKFSYGYTHTKTHMANTQSKSARVQVKYKLYSVKLQPGASLHPVFKARIFDIASSVQNNNTEYAHYLAELMVRDYGTHYVSSMDAGAILSQVYFVKVSNGADMSKQTTQITASASATFFSMLSVGAAFKYNTANTDTSGFSNSLTHSQVITVGGPPYSPNMTLDQWKEGVDNTLVAIDRSGVPLHFAINPTSLPQLPATTIRTVGDIMRQAINRYYKANTRLGCTDPEAENFNFQANLDDKSCKSPPTNFTFGGIFQNCTVLDNPSQSDNLCTGGPEAPLQNNVLTGNLSCPANYTPVLLHSGTITIVKEKSVCNRVCNHCGLFGLGRCCHTQCALKKFLDLVHYDTYWCVALNGVSIKQNDGFLFGGFYTSKLSNPVTGAMTCPQYFYPVHMLEDTQVCVSTDYTRAYAHAVDFAGFESCTVGNPLADSKPNDNNKANWPHACPHGYAQHLVTVEDTCEINFCVHVGAFGTKQLLPPKLPPFRKHPRYKENVTNTLVVFGMNGETWTRNDEGGWDAVDSGSPNGQALLSTLEGGSPGAENKGHLSSGIVAAISVPSVLALTLLIVAIALGYQVYKNRKEKRRSGYVTLSNSIQ